MLAPFIGPTRVAPAVFELVLGLWAVGLVALPALSFAMAKRAVLGAVVVVAMFLAAATVLSGGLRSPFGY